MATKNPILDELHAVRERLLLDAGGTLDALVDRLQSEEQKSDRLKYKPKRTTQFNGVTDQENSDVNSTVAAN